jgi:hypothetical protein
MNDNTVIAEIPGLYRVMTMSALRRTPGVRFDVIPSGAVPRVDAVDRVLHDGHASSPGPVGDVARPWYMHPFQDDNLLVLAGIRHVEIYTPEHGRVERFECTPDRVVHNGDPLHEGPCMLVWPRYVFHRVLSDAAQGSASVNLATHYPGFNIRTNFSIYDLDVRTGEHRVLREGHLDQS